MGHLLFFLERFWSLDSSFAALPVSLSGLNRKYSPRRMLWSTWSLTIAAVGEAVGKFSREGLVGRSEVTGSSLRSYICSWFTCNLCFLSDAVTKK